MRSWKGERSAVSRMVGCPRGWALMKSEGVTDGSSMSKESRYCLCFMLCAAAVPDVVVADAAAVLLL